MEALSETLCDAVRVTVWDVVIDRVMLLERCGDSEIVVVSVGDVEPLGETVLDIDCDVVMVSV